MDEFKHDKTQRGYALIGVLGITVLALLMMVSIVGAEPFAYVTSYGDNIVSVIDTATNQVTDTIYGFSSPQGIAATGTKVYVVNTGNNTVSVISTATNTVTATIPISLGQMAATPDGTTIYAVSAGNTVSVIDTATNQVTDTIYGFSSPQGIAATGTKVYVVNTGNNTVSVISTATNTVTATIPVGNTPRKVAINPTETKLYVTNADPIPFSKNGTISVVDTATNSVIASVNLGASPNGIAVDTSGSKVYVTLNQIEASYGDSYGTVAVIDTATNAITAIVPIGYQSTPIVVAVTGTKAYVVNTGSGNVLVIDTTTDKVIAFTSVGVFPCGIAITSLPKLIFPVSNFSVNVTSGYAPLSVQFTDLSENATSRNWDFENDGIIDSTEETPVYVYTNPGTYTVNLTAINTNNTDSKTATITVLKATPTITWSNPADIISGTALSSTQLNAVATDPVTGATVDGTFTYDPAAGNVLAVGNAQNLHADFAPSDPTIYNPASADVQINVLEQPVPPVADFSASPTTGKASLTVTFTDNSAGSPTSWSWKFGDKSTSTDQNPVHTYNKTGKYTVSLTVENELGSDTKKISKYIIVKNKLKK